MNKIYLSLQQPKNLHPIHAFQTLADRMLSAVNVTVQGRAHVYLTSSAIPMTASKDVVVNVKLTLTAYLTWLAQASSVLTLVQVLVAF